MKALGDVLPWTIVTAMVGGVTWFLLSRDAVAGRWLLAAFLIGHGVVHLLFAAPGGTGDDGWPFDTGRSWLVSLGIAQPSVRALGWTLIGIAAVGFTMAGMSTLGLAVPAGWWPVTTVASSIASAGALVAFFNPQFILGLGIDLVLALVAGFGRWLP